MKHEENFEAAKAMESHPMIPKQPPPPLMMALGSLLIFSDFTIFLVFFLGKYS